MKRVQQSTSTLPGVPPLATPSTFADQGAVDPAEPVTHQAKPGQPVPPSTPLKQPGDYGVQAVLNGPPPVPVLKKPG